MAAIKRKSLQGVLQILEFNRHFFLIAIGVIASLLFTIRYLPTSIRVIVPVTIVIICITILNALIVSWYVYDWSGLYNLQWIRKRIKTIPRLIFNIHAGFDETSALLKNEFPDAGLKVFDFYDPAKHREISIKRARKKYPPYPDTISIETNNFPKQDTSADLICLFLSAHEIRDEQERIQFLIELKENLTDDGQIILVEHLRDWRNFLAYTFGVFHFHSKLKWERNINLAGLCVTHQHKYTSFISVYYLNKK